MEFSELEYRPFATIARIISSEGAANIGGRWEVEALDFSDAASRPVTAYGSSRVHGSRIGRSTGEAYVTRLRFDAGGVLGMHPAGVDQFFLVVEGAGWVRTRAHARKQELHAGQGILWRAGEDHESGTGLGMTVIVIQAGHLQVDYEDEA